MSVHSAITGHRTLVPVPSTSRRKCSCCGKRATLTLMADGAAMGNGCELFGRRWLKDPISAFQSIYRLKSARNYK